MNNNFWVKFAITEAINVAEMFLGGSTKIADPTKAAFQKFIDAGKEVLAGFHLI